MLSIKHILFPVDFSEQSSAAAPFVATTANRFGAKVTLLSVAQPFWYSEMGDPSFPVMFDTDSLKENLQSRLDEAFSYELLHVPVIRVAELGDPAEVIVEYARREKIDLIMMASHGYGPIRSLLLGSVADKVLHEAPCPVWIGAHVKDPPMVEHLACRKIACAVDASPASQALMKWSSEYAGAMEANLRLVHAVPGVEAWPEKQLDAEHQSAVRKQARQAIEENEHQAGIDAPVCVNVGDVAEVVREQSIRHRVDLIVIGRGVLREKLGRLRTQAYSIIRNAPCPVISV